MHTHHVTLTLVSFSLLAACSAQTPSPVLDENSQASTQAVTVTPNAQATDSEHGEMTSIAIGALSGANGALANGVATAYSFEDGASVVGVQLNIAAAKEGTTYDAWLEDAAGKRLHIGTLESSSGDVRHYARLTTQTDTRTYRNVIILLRKNTDAAGNGEVIATGIMKDSGH